MYQKQSSTNDKQKIKMKKNAMDFVNFEEEKRKDPKYKTELCKSWIDTGFCVYGNKCRFAHGRHELFGKNPANNYKKKSCKSFNETGICPYGARCNFKHDERKLNDITLSYFFIKLFIRNDITPRKRLSIFEEITDHYYNESCSVSTLSNDEEEETSNEEKCLKNNHQGLKTDMDVPIESVLSFMM